MVDRKLLEETVLTPVFLGRQAVDADLWTLGSGLWALGLRTLVRGMSYVVARMRARGFATLMQHPGRSMQMSNETSPFLRLWAPSGPQ